jgi:uncharacterized protein YecE (DUF72 family)
MELTSPVLNRCVEPKLHAGTCAWSCEEWRGPFYPPHLAHNRWLSFYSRHLPAVEVDSTFYHTPSPATVEHWLEGTPDDFVFTCKVPREITHDMKLRDFAQPMAHFLAALEPLRPKLGCILVQLPPYFQPARDEAALRAFVRGLPEGFRFAFEFRHPAWHVPRVVRLLQDHGICWAWTDLTSVEDQERGALEFLPLTAGFVYVRLLGDPSTQYAPDGTRIHRYDRMLWPRTVSLENWSLKIRRHLPDLAAAYVFAGNHFEGFAPETAVRITALFGHVPHRDTGEEPPAESHRLLQPDLL